MSDSRLFDPALQPERTQLAWRRTALSIAVGSIAALRILPDVLGGSALWTLPGVVGVLFAGYLWWAAHARHAAYTRWLTTDAGGAPGGRSIAALAAFTVGAAVISIVTVLAVNVVGR